MPGLGLIFPPDQPPERLREVALATERAGFDELWIWEDCFKESGIATAAAVLAWTERISVGIGLLPVPLRNVALTAMELATLARLFPGRLLPGIGHGVLDWMGQVGARVESPMTLLREHAEALTALLTGDAVSTDGRYVRLDDIRLDWPPEVVPPLLIGAVRPKTMALAGRAGAGVIIDNPTALRDGLPVVKQAWAEAGREGSPEVVVFCPVPVGTDPAEVAATVRESLAAGATSVPLVLTDATGAPDGSGALLDAIPALGAVRDLL